MMSTTKNTAATTARQTARRGPVTGAGPLRLKPATNHIISYLYNFSHNTEYAHTMNATRTIILRLRTLPIVGSTGPHKQSQINFFVALATTNTKTTTPSASSASSFARPSARAIQLLLGNIGVGHRASLHTIECMIRHSWNHGEESNDERDDAGVIVKAEAMIDLIAQIRSL
jgi:hypothetical protein